jgi:hypothetical protein
VDGVDSFRLTPIDQRVKQVFLSYTTVCVHCFASREILIVEVGRSNISAPYQESSGEWLKSLHTYAKEQNMNNGLLK